MDDINANRKETTLRLYTLPISQDAKWALNTMLSINIPPTTLKKARNTKLGLDFTPAKDSDWALAAELYLAIIMGWSRQFKPEKYALIRKRILSADFCKVVVSTNRKINLPQPSPLK